MAKRAYSPEQIINKLREVEVLISQGATAAEASRKIGVTEQTYYRLAQGIRWHAAGAGKEAERVRKRELPSEEASSRHLPGQCHLVALPTPVLMPR